MAAEDLFAGGGELGELMRRHDWAASPLGPVDAWPRALKTAVRIMLTSRQPMFVWWGDQLINLYNDAYRTIVGGKHPLALGQPASAVWREIWDDVGPRAASAIARNEGTYDEALLLIMERHGYAEETYYTFSYSPVPNDEGGVGGILCANSDDTPRIVSERQLALLRELAARAAQGRTVEEACALAAEALETDSRDLPFGLIYLLDTERRCMTLAGAAGLAPGHPAAPAQVGLESTTPWPLEEVLALGEPRVIADLSAIDGLPKGAWDRAPSRAVALPLAPAGENARAGVLVAGLNPYRLFDDRYQGFLALVVSQIAGAVVNAQAYEDERRRVEALAELDRVKTTFFSNVSHEFRTPLTLMLGPLEEVLAQWDAAAAPSERALLQTAHRNGLRLLKLVNTLLDFARIEAGRVQARYEPTDLASVTAELAATFRSAIDRAGLRLVVETAPLPEPVYVDRDMWEKVVLNLLSNAFKFTMTGEIRVAVAPDPAAREAVVAVADTGTGIPPVEQPRLFERFHRVEGARGRTHEGTGIGLALVQELVRLHGGTVAVNSEPGRGSIFTVRLPLGTGHLDPDRIGATPQLEAATAQADAFVEEALRWVHDEPVPAPSTPVEEGAMPTPPATKPRVVVADDNADMRGYVRRLLHDGYDVRAVANGEDALRIVHEGGADLVLSDVMMPVLDGFGLLRALRSDPRTARLPFILLSARAGEEARVEGLEAGADDYVVKPFAARELQARVGATLHLARVRAEANAALLVSEQRYRSLAEATSQVIWTTDAAGNFTTRSPSYEAFTGLTWDQYKDGGAMRAIHPSELERVRAEWSALLASGAPGEMRFRLRRADGAYRQVIGRGVPVRDEEGRLKEWVGTISDIEDQRQAEDRLRQAAKMEAVGRLAGGLAHDFNNQLQGIAGFTSFVERDAGLSAQALQDLHEVRKASERMASLTHQLLAFSRQQVLMPEAVNLDAAVADSQSLLQRLIGSNIEIVVQLAPGARWVKVDRAQFLQVLMNLAINARDAMPHGGKLVIATATLSGAPEREADAGPYAALTVTDSGAGISAEDMPHIFDPFFTTKGIGEGTGLGLATVHGIVAQSRGHIWAESTAGSSTTFTVLLPLATEPGGPAAMAAAASTGRVSPATVLVADDEDIIRSLMKRALVAAGYDVLLARNGREALDLLERHRGQVDVVLSDLVMPVMDGRELAERIRGDFPELPVIWMSGHPKDTVLLQGMGIELEPFLQKPLSAEVLVQTVSEVLERARPAATRASPGG